jgi:hypothetical protein
VRRLSIGVDSSHSPTDNSGAFQVKVFPGPEAASPNRGFPCGGQYSGSLPVPFWRWLA